MYNSNREDINLKVRKYQLPNRFKSIGWSIAALIFMLFIGLKFTENEPMWIKYIAKQILLLGLLFVSLAKEKQEDERTAYIRSQSYSLAFIFGAIYFFVEPYVDNLVNIILKGNAGVLELNSFKVIAFMLLVQIMFFERFKRC